MYVILDFSSYRNLLHTQQKFPYDPDSWAGFLHYAGSRYAHNPAILNYSIAGEPAAPKGRDPFRPTTTQLTDFYRGASMQLRLADQGRHLISSGGLLYLDWDSGIDWRAIFSLPAIDIAAIHVYSQGDRDTTMPNVSSWAGAHGKVFQIEEFGFLQSMGDAARAAAFQDIYTRGKNYQAGGIAFWNLGPELSAGSHQVGPDTPAVWKTVIQNSPTFGQHKSHGAPA